MVASRYMTALRPPYYGTNPGLASTGLSATVLDRHTGEVIAAFAQPIERAGRGLRWSPADEERLAEALQREVGGWDNAPALVIALNPGLPSERCIEPLVCPERLENVVELRFSDEEEALARERAAEQGLEVEAWMREQIVRMLLVNPDS